MALEDEVDREPLQNLINEKLEEKAEDLDEEVPERELQRARISLGTKYDQIFDEVLENIEDSLETDIEAEINAIEEVSQELDLESEAIEQEPEGKDPEVEVEETELPYRDEDPVETVESRGTEKLAKGDLVFTVIGQGGGVHDQAIYIAEELGLDVDYEEDGRYFSNARHQLRDNDFEIDQGDLETEIPEDVQEELEQRLADMGYLATSSSDSSEPQEGVSESRSENSASGPSYELTEGKLLIENGGEYEIPIWDQDGLTEEAEVLADFADLTAPDGSTWNVMNEDDFVMEEYFPGFNNLRDQGLVEAGDFHGDGKRNYRLQVDIPDEARKELAELTRKTARDDIVVGRVEGVGTSGEVKVRYNGGFETVKSNGYDLDPGDNIVLEPYSDEEIVSTV